VYGNPSVEGSHYKEFYLCASRSRRAGPFWGEPFSRNTSVTQYKLVGDRLGFVAFSEGGSSGASTTIGWVQLPRGPIKDAAEQRPFRRVRSS